jgi:hypothetical protein
VTRCCDGVAGSGWRQRGRLPWRCQGGGVACIWCGVLPAGMEVAHSRPCSGRGGSFGAVGWGSVRRGEHPQRALPRMGGCALVANDGLGVHSRPCLGTWRRVMTGGFERAAVGPPEASVRLGSGPVLRASAIAAATRAELVAVESGHVSAQCGLGHPAERSAAPVATTVHRFAGRRTAEAHRPVCVRELESRERSTGDRERTDMERSRVLWLGFWLLVVSGCGWEERVHGSGDLETVTSKASSFDRVSLNECDGRIDYASSYSVVVEVDDNVKPHLEIEEEAGTLEIGLDSGFWYDHVTCRATITLPALRSVRVADSANARVAGFADATDVAFRAVDSAKLTVSGLSARRVTADVSDSSALTGSVTSDALKVEVSDSSDATLKGSAGSVSLTAEDSSSVNLAALKADDVQVRLRDSSDARVWVTDALSGSASDSSELRYQGKPLSVSVSTSDSSSVTGS